ncbi:uncharacterized protein LOC116300954 [Actinia tenebrosa]|uniref:Uncharacterized protein LOC116300954 n=1 Tax=Actinia tenebrosa TaxID=6105 RepID=A0A6P8IGD3_ACTTE|nr:uncharacterized protein LOC116300954 [Actinia tenebrosa]
MMAYKFSSVQETATCVLVLYLVLMPNSLSQQVETNPEVLVFRSLKSIGSAIHYFMNMEASIDTNELLGLRVVAESLFTTIENCMDSAKVSVPQAFLEELKLLCARLNVLIPRVLNIYKPTINHEYKTFIASHLKGFRYYRPIRVDKEDRTNIQNLEGLKLEDFQECLGDLSLRNASLCIISNRCWKVLQPKMAKGQSLPYQAMILVMIELLGCSSVVNKKWSPLTIEDAADDICYSLYPKVSSFHANDFVQDPEEVGSFLDSFFACSLLGFHDFLQVTHMRIPAVVKWQLPSGCFGLKDLQNADEAGTCVPRISSAAIGQLGLYLKWLLDPTGFTALTGNTPFPSPSGFIPILCILGILILALFCMRRVRRFILGLLWRVLELLPFTKR